MKKTWLFVDSASFFGGHETMLLRLIEGLAHEGRVRPLLIARAGTKLYEHANAKPFLIEDCLPPVKTGGVGLVKRFFALKVVLAEIRILAMAIRKIKPDLCIIATGHLGYIENIVAARISCYRTIVYVPLVDSFSVMGAWRHARFKDFIVRSFSANVVHAWLTITSHQASTFKAWARPRGSVHWIPNAISSELERNAENLRAFRQQTIHGCVLRVLVLGRLDAHQKGLDFLIDYLEGGFSENSDIHVSIVGDGPYGNFIRARLTANTRLAKGLTLLPWGDTSEILTKYDVLLLPSRFEGVPLVMLEAMAVGMPVVASDLPGTREHLSGDWLFPDGDIAAAFSLLHLLADKRARNLVAAQNIKRFEHSASGAAFASAVSRLVDELDGNSSITASVR